MGFAYAQGLIANLRTYSSQKDKIKWGGYYIIAPENGCADSIDPGSFEEVWQYGSNLGEVNADPVWDQDGVAPQCAVQHISDNPAKGGRAFIPANYQRTHQPVLITPSAPVNTPITVPASTLIPKGFLPSHSIGNYGWIFELLPNQGNASKGYVTPR